MARKTKPVPAKGDAMLPVFAEPVPGPDQNVFSVEHTSDNVTYEQVQALLKKQVVGFPASRAAPDALFTLANAFGPAGAAIVEQITQSGRIVFHSVGDTGASDVRRYQNELRVADQVTSDAHSPEISNRASFFFHLGDVVYNFGESRYYYDQFYEPYRAYPAPILAIPGNHDSFILPGTPAGETPLDVFTRNFCSSTLTTTIEAGSLHRTAMTQPGVYFVFDAPFVRIIALFSNALEDPGVISSEDGRWPGVPDIQLDFLRTQLQRIKRESYAGAVILAMHHPPFVYSNPPAAGGAPGNHGSSSDMLRDIDRICLEVGVYPHAVLSAHAHCYQRYTRNLILGGHEYRVPFVVCGNGGHNVNPLVRSTRAHMSPGPENGADVSYLEVEPAVQATLLKLEKYDDHDYGYLRISADAHQLRIAYHQAGTRSLLQSRFDLVTIDLKSHDLLPNG